VGMLLHRHLVGVPTPTKPIEETKKPVLEEKAEKVEIAETIAESEVIKEPKPTNKSSKKASK